MTNPNNGQFPVAGHGAPAGQSFGPVPNMAMYVDLDASNALYLDINGAWLQTTAGPGGGDVVGPAAATANDLAAFNGITGKVIKDSGIAVSTAGTFISPLTVANAPNAAPATGVIIAGDSARAGVDVD